jgi:hypothetical protein
MKLAETQALFWNALQGAPADLEACFAGTPDLPARERVQIYAEMFLWRQVDALREDFPKLAAALGEDGFVALARAYIHAHPSEHPDLGKLGRNLAVFAPAPLRDLAALEWARAELFFEEERAAIEALPAGAEGFAQARLALVPALRLLELAHDAPAMWARIEDGEAPGAPERRACFAAVWRAGFDVFHAELPAEEAAALRLARDGATLAEVCGAFGAPEPAFAALQSWLAEGWVAAAR